MHGLPRLPVRALPEVTLQLRAAKPQDCRQIDGTTGSCGKDGQWKPVGVGQPTVRFTEITVLTPTQFSQDR